MEIRFSRNLIEFLNKLTPKSKEQIREKVLYLLNSLDNLNVIPFQELNIKKLKGNWWEFFRMCIGKIRVIFTIEKDRDELLIYEIDFRGDVYK